MKCGEMWYTYRDYIKNFVYIYLWIGIWTKKIMNNWNNPVKTECTGSISPASKTRVPSIFVIYETLPIHKI